jgi:hypothetical protein
LRYAWRKFVVERSERGIAAIGLIAIIGAIVGGAALGGVLVVSGAVDPISESDNTQAEVSVTTATTPTLSTVSALTANVQLLDCREGQPVGSVIDGDSVYVMGKDASGDWVAIRRPGALAELAWLPVAFLESDEDLSTLPVTPCGPQDGGAIAALGDTSTTTTEEPPGDTTEPPGDTTIPPPDTTIPTETTIPPPDTTLPTTPPPDTTLPPDTDPPIVVDLIVEPATIYPGAEPAACDNTPDTPIFGSAYATVTNEVGPITATLMWEYVPTSYEYSGSFPVSIEPSGAGFQLIGNISDLPQPYSYGISAPQIKVELTWRVTDDSGNLTTVVDIFDLGRCV